MLNTTCAVGKHQWCEALNTFQLTTKVELILCYKNAALL